VDIALIAIVEHKRRTTSVVFFSPPYGSQWGASTVWLPILPQNSFFCVQQKKGLEQLEDE